ncbi:hypothetical protein SJA_C1-03560 [Sphingobium indicum UT26S]|uniref:Uncharacterized protein n=1 Tax=Sphingobium indicum (strain DSM 16413 / CCM 7287 / MTCC 6362 / UT26 / NBRC 101211 / UT26S) TaxID=452662 RepID=D4YXV8_SPHIU|nr:hypothetical protein SJA_C1-03560 [Sphingobium indicum UT26S]
MGRDARRGWLGGAKRNRAGSRHQRETLIMSANGTLRSVRFEAPKEEAGHSDRI